MTETSPGTCTKCDSEDVDYHNISFDIDTVTWDFSCSNCGAVHEEVHRLVFLETRLKED